MTLKQLDAFGADVHELFIRHKDAIANGDLVIDTVMLGLAELVKREREGQTHELVIACLDGCINALRHGAMDYYVSYK